MKIWSNSLNKEFNLHVESFLEGGGEYFNNALSIISRISVNQSSFKKLIQYVDILGRVTNSEETGKLIFHLYDDGTVIREFLK